MRKGKPKELVIKLTELDPFFDQPLFHSPTVLPDQTRVGKDLETKRESLDHFRDARLFVYRVALPRTLTHR